MADTHQSEKWELAAIKAFKLSKLKYREYFALLRGDLSRHFLFIVIIPKVEGNYITFCDNNASWFLKLFSNLILSNILALLSIFLHPHRRRCDKKRSCNMTFFPQYLLNIGLYLKDISRKLVTRDDL
jgi:hypothetical protein